MQKIALIADIHSNIVALKATLKDIEKRNVDEIYCLGDIIGKSVHPKECIEIVRNKCSVILKGNSDEYFATTNKSDDKIEQDRIDFNNNMINNEDYIFLRNLPLCYEFYMSGSLIRLFHARADSVYRDDIIYIDKPSLKAIYFKPTKYTSDKMADIVIYADVHSPFIEKLYNRTLVNTGSIGNATCIIRDDAIDANPMEITQASYVIIEGEIGETEYNSSLSLQIVRVPYNIEEELEYHKNELEKEAYEHELRYGRYRDIHKLDNLLKGKI